MAWQQGLRIAHPHLRASLYRRDEVSADGPAAAHVTLMEVYAIDAQGGCAALDAALERRLISEGDAVLAPWLQGPRKVEAFVRCEPA